MSSNLDPKSTAAEPALTASPIEPVVDVSKDEISVSKSPEPVPTSSETVERTPELDVAPTVTEAKISKPAAIDNTNANESTATEPVAEPTTNEPADDGSTVPVIEADDLAVLQSDSAFGDEVSRASSTSSLHSSIFKYRKEHGRSYHAYKDGAYLIPNDEEEQDRLQLQHHLFYIVNNGKLFSAPINNPARVLDVGTGTGIWALDFADQNPDSHVVGCDLSPIQPQFVSPNCEFELHKPFNFIHARCMAGSLLSYRKLLEDAFVNLAPGGWCEAAELEVWGREQGEEPRGDVIDTPLQGAPMFQQWQTNLHAAGDMIGRRFDAAWNLKAWFEDIGYVNVVQKKIKVPMAPWPKDRVQKEIGMYLQENMMHAASSYGNAHFTRVLGWSNDEFAVLSAGVRNELRVRACTCTASTSSCTDRSL